MPRATFESPELVALFTAYTASPGSIGAHLARLEAQVAVGTLLQRLPRLRLDPRYDSAPRGLVFRKPPDLYARWEPQGRAG